MKSAPLALLLVALALAGCERAQPRPDASPTTAVTPAPTGSPVEPPATAEQLTATAFRAAWNGPPPVQSIVTRDDQDWVFTYRSGRLVPLGGPRYAFVSDGQGGASHAAAGALSIHYLTRTGEGFERTGAWPDVVVSGTFGAPPQWSVRSDLMPSPALVASGGGTWQGYTCSWADVVELTPDRPVMRAEGLHLAFDSAGARGDAGERYDGEIQPGQKGQTFVVRYSNVERPITYARVGDTYDPVAMPDMAWC